MTSRLTFAFALLCSVSALAQETWYLRTTTAATCTGISPINGAMSQTAGASTTSANITSATQFWAYDEDRDIASGTWTFTAEVRCDGGSGAQPTIALTLRRRRDDGSCTIQATLASCTGLTASKANTVEVECSASSVAQQTFADNDRLTVSAFRESGTVTCYLEYNGVPTAADSRVVHPNQFVAGDDLMVIGAP